MSGDIGAPGARGGAGDLALGDAPSRPAHIDPPRYVNGVRYVAFIRSPGGSDGLMHSKDTTRDGRGITREIWPNCSRWLI